MFQIFTVLSRLPLATDAPSGLQTTDMTLRFDEMSQHAKQLDKRRKLDKTKKKNLTDLSARSESTKKKGFVKKIGIRLSKKKSYQRECPVRVF